MIVGSVLAVLIVAAAVAFILIRKHKLNSKNVDSEGNLQVISFQIYQHNFKNNKQSFMSKTF